jgi:hypothetical protein
VFAGAVGGIVGTVAMTAAMRRLFAALPSEERYPMPPREITERTMPAIDEAGTRDLTVLTHLGFGAVAGAVSTAVRPLGPGGGSLWGIIVWLGSYFGWVPLGGILKPASEHPVRRSALMIVVHLVWGSVTAIAAKELLAARSSILAAGPLRDAQPADRSSK